MTEEMKYFIYLTEYYANYKGRFTGDLLKEWEEKGILDKIYGCYWIYHCERMENAYEDIDSLMETGKYAW
ncbi:MAG: DUF3791 domain-containing protein [Clostridia bacterium]|nr:DUF3791 domain-containing protein [Clostridia bacterium]